VHHPGIEIRRIKMVNGSDEFCEEFLTDVRIPADSVLGEVNAGWTVGTRWMFHEKNGSGGGSVLTIGAGNGAPRGPSHEFVALARQTGVLDDPVARQGIGEAWMLGRVQEQLVTRVSDGLRHGRLPEHAAGLMRLFRGVAVTRQATIARDLCGVRAAAWSIDDDAIRTHTVGFVARQVSCLGGGSTEMARNVISERLLGMPRELAADRDVPYRDVRRSARTAAREGRGDEAR